MSIYDEGEKETIQVLPNPKPEKFTSEDANLISDKIEALEIVGRMKDLFTYSGKPSSIQEDPSLCVFTDVADSTGFNNRYDYLGEGVDSPFQPVGAIEYIDNFGFFNLFTVSKKSGGSISGEKDQDRLEFSFMHYGDELVYRGNALTPISVLVDGVYSNKLEKTLDQPPTSGSLRYLKLSFGGGVQLRKITINLGSLSGGFQGVYCKNGQYVSPPNLSKVKVAAIGDSTYSGTGAQPYHESIINSMQRYFNLDTIMSNSIGATGLLATASGVEYNYNERISDVISFNPDVIIFGCSQNDVSFNQAQIEDAFLTWYTAIRSAMPNVFIIINGISGRQKASSIALEADYFTSVDNVVPSSDKRVIKVASQNAENYPITGTGFVGGEVGIDNANIFMSDEEHPNEIGYPVWTEWQCRNIEKAISNL